MLNSEKRAGHVTLQACKSMFGHSEASAGTAGLMFTCIEVSLGKALDLVHLRNLNPHLEPLMSSSSVGVKLLATRQSNPFCGADNTIRSGLSSFAYQVGYFCVSAHELIYNRIGSRRNVHVHLEFNLCVRPHRGQTCMLLSSGPATNSWIAM